MQYIEFALHKIVVHLPDLQFGICLQRSNGFRQVARGWAPLQVLYDARVVHVWEDEVWWAVFVIISSLLQPGHREVPNVDLVVVGSRGQYAFVRRAPLQRCHLLLVVRHHVHGFLGHSHVPDVDYSCGISAHCEYVLIVGTKLPDAETLLGIFVGHDELFLRLAEVPDFKVAVICS